MSPGETLRLLERRMTGTKEQGHVGWVRGGAEEGREGEPARALQESRPRWWKLRLEWEQQEQKGSLSPFSLSRHPWELRQTPLIKRVSLCFQNVVANAPESPIKSLNHKSVSQQITKGYTNKDVIVLRLLLTSRGLLSPLGLAPSTSQHRGKVLRQALREGKTGNNKYSQIYI